MNTLSKSGPSSGKVPPWGDLSCARTVEADITCPLACICSEQSLQDIVKVSIRKETCVMFSHSVTSDSVTPWTVACQAPLSMDILQARILEWVAISFSKGSSQPRDRTQVSALQEDSWPSEPPGKPRKQTGKLNKFVSKHFIWHLDLRWWEVNQTQSWTALTTRLDTEPTAWVVVLGGLPSCPPAVPSTLTSGAKSVMVSLVSPQSLGSSAGKIVFILLGHLFAIVSLVTFFPSETWPFSLHWSALSCLFLLGHEDTARPSGQGFYYYLFSQAPVHWTYNLFNSNHKKPLKVILVNGFVTFVILNF